MLGNEASTWKHLLILYPCGFHFCIYCSVGSDSLIARITSGWVAAHFMVAVNHSYSHCLICNPASDWFVLLSPCFGVSILFERNYSLLLPVAVLRLWLFMDLVYLISCLWATVLTCCSIPLSAANIVQTTVPNQLLDLTLTYGLYIVLMASLWGYFCKDCELNWDIVGTVMNVPYVVSSLIFTDRTCLWWGADITFYLLICCCTLICYNFGGNLGWEFADLLFTCYFLNPECMRLFCSACFQQMLHFICYGSLHLPDPINGILAMLATSHWYMYPHDTVMILSIKCVCNPVDQTFNSWLLSPNRFVGYDGCDAFTPSWFGSSSCDVTLLLMFGCTLLLLPHPGVNVPEPSLTSISTKFCRLGISPYCLYYYYCSNFCQSKLLQVLPPFSLAGLHLNGSHSQVLQSIDHICFWFIMRSYLYLLIALKFSFVFACT